jgi:uncharacterized damage-inducible protein DinB
LLAEFDHEMAVTRHLLTRVPEASLTWAPHPKSFSLGGLATHLARLPHWGEQILTGDAYDLAASGPPAAPLATLADVLELFDRHVAEVRHALATGTAAALATDWSLRRGSETLLSVPKIPAFRRFLLHHLIHHRGQLTVYLRLLDVPLPPIYGPTADERP